jgi:hypothetical protein
MIVDSRRDGHHRRVKEVELKKIDLYNPNDTKEFVTFKIPHCI